jgi:hypothetical protein
MNWRRFFRREQTDSELRDELEFYADLTAEEYVARGMKEEDARRKAKRKLGNPALIREEIYRMNTIAVAETVWHDIRYACRTLATEHQLHNGSRGHAGHRHRIKRRPFSASLTGFFSSHYPMPTPTASSGFRKSVPMARVHGFPLWITWTGRMTTRSSTRWPYNRTAWLRSKNP